MRKNILTLILSGLIISILFSSGCIFMIAGTVGALGGYAISQDTIQGETDKKLSNMWDTALEILDIMGTVTTENMQKGEIEGKIDNASVKIKIEEITPKTTKLRVSVRKYMMPNIKLAQKIFIKIIERSK